MHGQHSWRAMLVNRKENHVNRITALFAALALRRCRRRSAQEPIASSICWSCRARRVGRHQYRRRRRAGRQGDQRSRRRARTQVRGDDARHAEQSRRVEGARAEGGRHGRVRRHRSDVLGRDGRERRGNAPSRNPELHRRRRRVDHAAGQSVRDPHEHDAGGVDAEARALHQGWPQGELGRYRLHQLRLRQRRPRRIRQGVPRSSVSRSAPTSRPTRARSIFPAPC